MNPLSAVSHIVKAITYPFHMLFVVGLCYFINAFTSPGHWWFQWVAFGMGIGLIAVWARALKTLAAATLAAAIACLVYRWLQRRKAAGQPANESAHAANG